MAGLVKFVPNPTGIALLAKEAAVQAALKLVAEAIIEGAKDHAPELSGDYVDGLQVVTGEIPGTLLALAADWKSNWIEFGTGEPAPTPAFAPLRLGADSAGVVLRSGGDEEG